MIRDVRPAIKLIREFEGLSLIPYKDSVGVPTIGIGTTVYPNGTPVKMSDPAITEEQAVRFLEHHLSEDIIDLENFLTVKKLTLTNNQFCSLLCFAYNLGVSPILFKGRSLHDALLKGSEKEVVEAIKLYCKAGGSVVPGLARRRSAEAQLYLA